MVWARLSEKRHQAHLLSYWAVLGCSCCVQRDWTTIFVPFFCFSDNISRQVLASFAPTLHFFIKKQNALLGDFQIKFRQLLRRLYRPQVTTNKPNQKNDTLWYTSSCTVCAVFTLNRSFYSTTSVHPVSVLILHPEEIQIMWSQIETE